VAEVKLFHHFNRTVPAVSSTAPRICGTYFTLTRTMWLKSIRFYRATTAMYGKIEGRIYRYTFSTDNYQVEPGTDISITLTSGQGATGWIDMTFSTPVKLAYSQANGGSFQVAVKFPGGSGNYVPFQANWWQRVTPTIEPDSNKRLNEDTVMGGLGLSAPTEENVAPITAPPGTVQWRGQSAYSSSSVWDRPREAAGGDHGLDIKLDELDPNDPVPAAPLYRTMAISGVPTYPSSGLHLATVQGEYGDYQEARGTNIGYDFEVTQRMWLLTLRVYNPNLAYANYLGGVYLRVYEQTNGTWAVLPNSTVKIEDTRSTPYGYGGWKEATLSGLPVLEPGRRYRLMGSFGIYAYLPGAAPNAGKTVGPINVLPGAYKKAPSSIPTSTSGSNTADLSMPTTATNELPLIDFWATIQDPYADPEGGGYGHPWEPNETAQRLWGVSPPLNYQIKSGPADALQEFEVTAPARAYGLRFYVPNGETYTDGGVAFLAVRAPFLSFIPVPGTIQKFGTPTFQGNADWAYVPFSHPVKLAVGTRYVVCFHFYNGYIETEDYWSTGLGSANDGKMVKGRLQIPENANKTLVADVYNKPELRHNRWVDVTISPWAGTPTGAKGSAVEPANAYRLFDAVNAPEQPVNYTTLTIFPTLWRTSTYVSSLQFSVDEDCTGHGLRFYRASSPNGMVRGRVVGRVFEFQGLKNNAFSGSEVNGADVTFDDGTSNGWVYAAFRSPIKLKPGKTYIIIMWFPNGMPLYVYPYADENTYQSIKVAEGPAAAEVWWAERLAEVGDIVRGPLRIPSPTNAIQGTPFRFHFAGVLGDNIAWPTSYSGISSTIDITVTAGVAGNAIDKQEPADSLNARGPLRPPPSDYGDILIGAYSNVIGHDMAFETNVTVYGVRFYCPDLRYVTGQVAIYQASTGTQVSGTLTTMNPVTGFTEGWMFIPFTNPVVLEGNTKYRVVMTAPYGLAAVPIGRGKVLETGYMRDISTWNSGLPPVTPTMRFPNQYDLNDYLLDLSYSVGGDPDAGLVVKTLFPDDLLWNPENLMYRVKDHPEYADVKLWSFSSVSGLMGRNVGIRFGVNQTTYAIGMRFPRLYTTQDGPVLGRIYKIYNDPKDYEKSGYPNRGTIGRLVSGSEVVINIDPEDITNFGWVSGTFAAPVRLEPGGLYTAILWMPGPIMIGEGWFLPGNPGDTGTDVVMGPKGTLYYGGTDWAPNRAQGVSKASTKPEYAWIGNYNENMPGGGPQRRPAGHNYFVDVMCVDNPPDYLPMELPRQTLAYSIYGRFPYGFGAPIGRSIMAGLEFYVLKTAYVSAYRFPRSDMVMQRQPVIAGLYEMTGENTATPIPETFGIINLVPTLWQSAHLNPAYQVVPGKRYKLVMQFLGAHPNMEIFQFPGAPTVIPWSEDIIRGPLVIPSDENALGQATATWTPAYSFMYPIYPATGEGQGFGHYLDLLVSEDDPNAEHTEVESSLFEKRLPAMLSQMALSRYYDTSGVMLQENRSVGTEVFFTQNEVYVTQYHYWRAAYPTSTAVEVMAVFEVINGSTGVEVPGSRVDIPAWPDNPFAPGGAAWAEGWVTINLPGLGVKLQGNKRYRVSAFFPYRHEQVSVPYTLDYWTTGSGAAGHFRGPMVAPNRQDSVGQLQSPETSYLAYENQGYEFEYPGTGVTVVPYTTRQYWIDATVLDTAPRVVDGGTVTKALSVGRRERRSSGVEATDSPVAQLAITGQGQGSKEISSQPTHELEIIATPFAGQALVLETLGLYAEAIAMGKSIDGGVVDYETALQTKQWRGRKRSEGEAEAELAVYGTAYESFRWAPIPREAQSFPFTWNPTHIRFIAQNIMTRQFLHMDLPIVNPQITWRLSGPFELTGTISPPYNDILDIMMDEWSTFIHVEYQGVIMGTGILMPWSADEHTLNIEAIGITTYPHGIPYMDHFHKFFPDVMEVVREIWRHLQSFPNGNMGVLLPSGFMGVPLFGKVHYDDNGVLLGWEEWNLHWTDFTDCGSFIDNLAVSTPFDYAEVHAWNSAHTDILHGINFGYPRMGGKRNNLKFEQGANIVDSISITEPEDNYVSDVIIKGSGEGPDQIYVWVGATLWDRLRRVVVITDEQVADMQMAYGIANQELVRRLYGRGLEKVVIEAFHLYAPLGSYDVGDDILIDAMIPFVGEFLLWHRITAIEYVRDTGLVTLQVARSESFRYGRPRPAGT
jgi:hypothetical protein